LGKKAIAGKNKMKANGKQNTFTEKRLRRENSEKLLQVEREFSCGWEDKAGSLKCSNNKKLSKMGNGSAG